MTGAQRNRRSAKRIGEPPVTSPMRSPATTAYRMNTGPWSPSGSTLGCTRWSCIPEYQRPRLTIFRSLLDCRSPAGTSAASTDREIAVGCFDAGSRRKVAVVVSADGRRIHVPLDPSPADVSLLDLLRSLTGLESLIGLITGSRRDRGTRSGKRK